MAIDTRRAALLTIGDCVNECTRVKYLSRHIDQIRTTVATVITHEWISLVRGSRFTVSRRGTYARDFTTSELAAAVNTGDASPRMPPFALLFTARRMSSCVTFGWLHSARNVFACRKIPRMRVSRGHASFHLLFLTFFFFLRTVILSRFVADQRITFEGQPFYLEKLRFASFAIGALYF